ncbi:MAG: extracellular solute-binding protein [Spirochaetales bacterium]|nr:extracellular solute-binding protein [Spirochaetales bacterium]
MKKGLSLLCLVLITISCLFAQGTKEQSLDMSAPVTLTLWTHEDPNRSVLEKELIAEFQKLNPNVTVDYQTYPSGKMAEMLTVAFSAGEGPDLFNQSQSVIRKFVLAGQTSALKPEWIGAKSVQEVKDRYIPGALEAVEYEDDLYGLPLEYTNLCLYLNKQIFRDAGLDPEKDAPKTWEDIMRVSEIIAQRNGEILTRRGFDFRYPSYTQQFLPMVEQLGGRLISEDGKTAVVNDAAWLKFFDYMKAWGPTGKNLGGPTYTAPRKAFDLNKNEIALSESGLYQEGRMKKANPDFYNSGDWAVIPYPQWEDAKQAVAGHISCHCYLVNGNISEAKQAWGWKLLDFMLSHGEDYLERVALVQPTYKLFESEAFKAIPYSEVFMEDLKKGTLVYFAENSGAINDKFKAAVEKSMLNGEDSKSVLDSFRKAVQTILDQE